MARTDCSGITYTLEYPKERLTLQELVPGSYFYFKKDPEKTVHFYCVYVDGTYFMNVMNRSGKTVPHTIKDLDGHMEVVVLNAEIKFTEAP